jgi:3-oxoadipate enol-lactonase
MPRAQVQGIDLYYLWEGTSSGDPVVLIPGFSAPLEMWAPTVPALAPEFRVLLYDLRGHGRSDCPLGGYDLETQAQDLVLLLDRLGVDRAHLVGDAAGGGIGVQVALAQPSRVRTLTLIGTRIHGWKEPEGSVPPAGPEQAAYDAEFQKRFREEGLPEILEQWWLGDWAAPMRNDPVRRRAQRFRDLILSYPGGAWQATLPARCIEPHHPRLPEIRCPTLVMVGGADMPIIQVNAREFTARIPGARLVTVPEAGHIPNWEFPDRFNPLLVEFLRSGGA